MKIKTYLSKTAPAAFIIALGTSVGLQGAVVISENFESGLGDWTNITHFDNGGALAPTFGTTTGNGGGTGAQVVAQRGAELLPGGYLVYTGGEVLDGSQTISGTFDFSASWVNGTYPAAAFIMGDISTGLTKDSGQLVGAWLGANTFGNRTHGIDGAGAELASASKIDYRTSGEWHTVTFSWTPTSGLTGDFSFTMTNQRNGATTVVDTSHTLASSNVYFGFGAGQPTSYGSTTAVYDNISITGTAVPEPSAFALLAGFTGLVWVMLRRR